MPNKCFINKDDFIEQVYEGDQDGELVESNLINGTIPLGKKLRDENKPVLILINLNKIGMPDASARKVALESLKKLDYDKIAVYTDNVYIKYVAKFVIEASNKSKTARVFKDRESAVKWLKNE